MGHDCIHFCDMEIIIIQVTQPLNKSLENYVKVHCTKSLEHYSQRFNVPIYASANKSNLHPQWNLIRFGSLQGMKSNQTIPSQSKNVNMSHQWTLIQLQLFWGLERTKGSLEARVQASNKERVYGLVCPNPPLGRERERERRFCRSLILGSPTFIVHNHL